MNDTKTKICTHSEKELVVESSRKPTGESDYGRRLWELYTCASFWLLLFLLFFGWLFILMLFFAPICWPFGLLWLGWTYYDRDAPHNGGRKIKFLRTLALWHYVRDYFPIRLVKTAELPPDTTYLFSCFPHGFLAFGIACNFGSNVNHFDDLFVGLNPYLMTMAPNFDLPLTRELVLWFGGCACSRKGVLSVLNGPPGNVSVLVVGGVAEALRTLPGAYTIVLKNRKGFVRLAIKAGSSLVPVFSFGEASTYHQISGEWYCWLQGKLKSIIGMPFVVVKGRSVFKPPISFLPFKVPITTVVGKPIRLPKNENPPDELVNKFHRIFIRELTNLFNEYKGKYDVSGEEATLTIE